MRYYILIIVCFLMYCPLYSQTTKEVNDVIINLEQRVKTLENSNYLRELESRLKIAHETIDAQDNLHNTFIIVVSILIALLAIIFSIISYYTAIKPAKEATREIKKYFEETFNKTKIERMNQAIEELNLNNYQIKKSAVNYIMNNHSDILTDIQILKICNIIDQTDEKDLKEQLVDILITHKLYSDGIHLTVA